MFGANLGEAAEQQRDPVRDVGHEEIGQRLGAAVRRQRQQDPLHHGLEHGAHGHVPLLDDPVHCAQELQLPPAARSENGHTVKRDFC